MTTISSSTVEQYNMPSTSMDTSGAIERINLENRLQMMSNEMHTLTEQLQLKDSLLTQVLVLSAAQSTALAQLRDKLSQTRSSDLDDTIPWDPSYAPQSCSTPQTSWHAVQIRGRTDQNVFPPPAVRGTSADPDRLGLLLEAVRGNTSTHPAPSGGTRSGSSNHHPHSAVVPDSPPPDPAGGSTSSILQVQSAVVSPPHPTAISIANGRSYAEVVSNSPPPAPTNTCLHFTSVTIPDSFLFTGGDYSRPSRTTPPHNPLTTPSWPLPLDKKPSRPLLKTCLLFLGSIF